MDIVLSFVVLGLCILAVIGYITACREIAKTAHEKGHENIKAVVCFFRGVPYMVSVMSLPNLKARQDFVQADFSTSSSFGSTSVSSPKSSPKATAAIIAAVSVAVGGFFAVRSVSASMEAKNEQLVYTEYAKACNELESSILSSSACRDAKVNSIDFWVDSVEKVDDKYIATVTAHCKTSAHYGYGALSQLEKELDRILVAYEIVEQIPIDITLNNGKRATLFTDTWQVYVYVDGEMVYYPGYKYS